MAEIKIPRIKAAARIILFNDLIITMIYRILSYDAFDSEKLNEVFDRLSDAQKNYIKRKNENSAKQSLAARALLATLLKEHYGEDLVGCIAADEKGRLYIDGRPDIFVSISHSKDAVAAAVSKKAIGIDIEHIRPVSEKLQKRICKESLGTEDEFFKIWTLKEAYVKASGIPFSKILALDVKEFPESAEFFSQKKHGYYITVVEMK